ncbi:MAG: choline dehydrogenase-like flavoprotein [Natronomonas sp.]|jgi:choline dehydrogenase-like flavoprotein|uniref:GMC family oxidoreductase n=1 Tax=Natronomonas sp. TaxID=2184060 RepID=UPI003989DA12
MTDPADVCIIGAGPVGGIIASELADTYDVVVLEAGPRFDDDRERRMERSIRPAYSNGDVWDMGGERDAFTTGENHYPLNDARVKGVGGSTLHWQGIVMRLHESDFEMQSRNGVGSDWPIEYDDLRPYYADAESELGVAGASDNPFSPPREEPYPLPAFQPSYSDSLFAEACEELGIATHSVPNARNSEPYDGAGACVGYGTCKPVCPSGAKYTAERHIDRAEMSGARVITEAPVQRLEHDDSGEQVTGAVYIKDGEERRQQATTFVLACGGIETPRLLLCSRSEQHPNGLANGSDAVGRYFMDHLFAGMGGRFDEPTRQNHVGFLTTESHQFYDDVDAESGSFKLEFSNYAGPSPVEIALDADEWGDALLERLRSEYGTHLALGALIEQLPHPENRVTLDPDRTDDHGRPVPRIEWHIDDYTKRTLARANEVQRSVLDEMGVEPEWTVGPENTGPAFHHMGTTRMGTDPAESVVTPRLRTHELDNLWISSSSVFVTGGAMNPTLTIAALSLKAAEHIDEALSQSF